MTEHKFNGEQRRLEVIDRWKAALHVASTNYEQARWEFADLLHYGYTQLEIGYDELEELTDTCRGSLYNKISMVNHFPRERRRWALSWSHYAAVQALPEDYQETILDTAAEMHMGSRAVRDIAQQTLRLMAAAESHSAVKSDPLPADVPTRYTFESELTLEGEYGVRLVADKVLASVLMGRRVKVTMEVIG